MITSHCPPASCASAAMSPTAATASVVERRAFATLCPSDADTTYSSSGNPAATARRAPP